MGHPAETHQELCTPPLTQTPMPSGPTRAVLIARVLLTESSYISPKPAFIESWNHRMVCVGRDRRAHPVPTSSQGLVSPTRLGCPGPHPWPWHLQGGGIHLCTSSVDLLSVHLTMLHQVPRYSCPMGLIQPRIMPVSNQAKTKLICTYLSQEKKRK